MPDSEGNGTEDSDAEQEFPPPPKVDKGRVSKDGDVQTEPGEVEDGSDKHDAERWQLEEHSLLVKVILAAIVLLGIFIILSTWRLLPFRLGAEETNNAYVKANTTVISPQAAGYVTEILVEDFDEVKAGQVLLKIDERAYENQLAGAQAQLEMQQANLADSSQKEQQARAQIAAARATIEGANAARERALADWRRASVLVQDGSISQREYDLTEATLRQSRSAVTQARAQLVVAQENLDSVRVARGALQASVGAAKAGVENATINLGYSTIVAPSDGTLSAIDVKVGQLVSPGTPLFYLVPKGFWVVANVKEVQTREIEVGQRVTLTVDALDDVKIVGRVARISPAAGSEFSLAKPDRAAGNFVKVPQRIPIRIDLDPEQEILGRLRAGMSVEAKFHLEGNIPPYKRAETGAKRSEAVALPPVSTDDELEELAPGSAD